MQWQKLVHRYHQTQVETSNPLHLVILAYDGVLTSIQKAVEKDRMGDYEQKSREIQRALDFVNELWSALDMERGSEIALSLSAIYRFVTSQTLEACVRKDNRTLELIYDLMKELREAWAQVNVDKPESVSASVVPRTEDKAPALAL